MDEILQDLQADGVKLGVLHKDEDSFYVTLVTVA